MGSHTYEQLREIQQYIEGLRDRWDSSPTNLRDSFPELSEPMYQGHVSNAWYCTSEMQVFTGITLGNAQRAWLQEWLLGDVSKSLQIVEMLRDAHARRQRLLVSNHVDKKSPYRHVRLVYAPEGFRYGFHSWTNLRTYPPNENDLFKDLAKGADDPIEELRPLYTTQIELWNKCAPFGSAYQGVSMEAHCAVLHLDIPRNPYLNPTLTKPHDPS